MGRLKYLAIIVLLSCSGLSYKYYSLDIPEVAYIDGKLLGPEPKDDQPFINCKPTESNKAPCVVMFTGEYFKVRRDMIELRRRLQQCERR